MAKSEPHGEGLIFASQLRMALIDSVAEIS